MNNLFTETGFVSLNKFGEQLCGDRVEIIEHEDETTIVLADGLGSGVKANILSTLTSKIIGTMASNGMSVEACVETIANTLPVCSQRQIAYSTFTIIQIDDNRQASIVQFDNPFVILLRDGKSVDYPKTLNTIGNKKIYESHLSIQTGDILITMSDGAIYAGVGKTLNYGWQRDNIIDYIEARFERDMSAKMAATVIADECNRLYQDMPGDDTTIAAVRIRPRQPVNVLIGPPANPADVPKLMALFFSKEGKRIVCGGTTSNIVADYLGTTVNTELDYPDPAVPPIGHIKGVDLVTEWVITISKVLDYAKGYVDGKDLSAAWADKRDGASLICQALFEDATDINFFVGKAMNPAHQNPDLPITFNIKIRLIEDLARCLEVMGKKIKVSYF